MSEVREGLDAPGQRRALEQMVAAVTRTRAAALHRPTRGRKGEAFARQLAMYLLHVEEGISLTAAGAAFGRDRATARHACHLVEDRRDERRFDRRLAGLADALARCRQTALLRPEALR